MTNYYQILGVATTATIAEIKIAYRKLVMIHHPDKGGNPEKFKQIQQAWDYLSQHHIPFDSTRTVNPNSSFHELLRRNRMQTDQIIYDFYKQQINDILTRRY